MLGSTYAYPVVFQVEHYLSPHAALERGERLRLVPRFAPYFTTGAYYDSQFRQAFR